MFEEGNVGTHGNLGVVCRRDVVVELRAGVIDCVEAVVGRDARLDG